MTEEQVEHRFKVEASFFVDAHTALEASERFDAVTMVASRCGFTPEVYAAMATEVNDSAVRAAVLEAYGPHRPGRLIEAIKAYRRLTGASLYDAKNATETIIEGIEHQPTLREQIEGLSTSTADYRAAIKDVLQILDRRECR